MKLLELTNYLESLAPLAWQESYDNSGLLVGLYDIDINKALLCVDVTEDVISEAVTHGCDLIISHHPFIFTGLKRITGSTETERIVALAIKHNISIYACHTNFDNYDGGVNKILSEKLGLSNLRILRPINNDLVKIVVFCPLSHTAKVKEAMFKAGAGSIGNYDSCSFNVKGEGSFRAKEGASPYVGEINQIHYESEDRIETIVPIHLYKKVVAAMKLVHPYEEVAYDVYPLVNFSGNVGSGMIGELQQPMPVYDYLQKIKQIIGIGTIRHNATTNKLLSKVAVCGGSGAFLIRDAMHANADIFLTGDIKYHEFFSRENSLIIADIGHFESEQFITSLLNTLLIKKFPTFATRISETSTNPVNYL